MASLVTERLPHSEERADGVPPLENGAHLSASEFLRRYESMPEVKRAELVSGVVYMASPLRIDRHGEPDNLIQTWLGVYSIATTGVKSASNSTTRLGPDDVPQPDALLRILPECGGRARVDAKGYLDGAPELIVEVAASSVSLDVREKLTAYRRARVLEYLVWRTEDRAVDWWILDADEYRLLPSASDSTLRSRTFPGLWLDVQALLAGDGPKVMSKLQEGLNSSEHAAFVASLKR